MGKQKDKEMHIQLRSFAINIITAIIIIAVILITFIISLIVWRTPNAVRYADFTRFQSAIELETYLRKHLEGNLISDQDTIDFISNEAYRDCRFSLTVPNQELQIITSPNDCEVLAPANCNLLSSASHIIECILYEFYLPSRYRIEFTILDNRIQRIEVRRQQSYLLSGQPISK